MRRANRFSRTDYNDEIYTINFLKQFHNISVTENCAQGYHTTTHPLLDLNFMVSSLRSRDESYIVNAFVKAYYDDSYHAIKWLFYLRDIKEGLGERRTFRTCLKFLAFSNPEIARAVMALIPEYGRYDDLLVFLDTPLHRDCCILLHKQLNNDLDAMSKGEPISLLGKWLPSNNTSSKETRRYAAMLMKFWNMDARTYRKTLAALRNYLSVTEVAMSASNWADIDYEKVPAKANLLYDGAFTKHDELRRSEYLREVFLGERALNQTGIVPHEIVHRYMKHTYYHALKKDILCELMWEKLITDGFKNEWGLSDCIVVADGSGSMYTPVSGSSTLTALEVCNALAIYFAEQLQGIFHNKAITFSHRPQFIDLQSNTNLKEKLEIMLSHTEVANTNIEAVFDLLLAMACEHNIPREHLPKQVLILSDMEFDCASSHFDVRLFDCIQKKYEDAGYQMPRLIFWNLCGRSETIPMVSNENGLCLLSGFSQNAMKVASNPKIKDPYESLIKVLDGPRYIPIENAIKALAS